jgi:Asp-tRNA(Asn)/Glu-tRNA(Gln) amidotransferase A subunit family amidase
MNKKRINIKEPLASDRPISRRTLFRSLPAGAVGVMLSRSASAQSGQQPEADAKISQQALHCAEDLIGIPLTDAQEKMALPGVNRNLTGYEALRKLEVPLDTEPAISFHPLRPRATTRQSASTVSKNSRAERIALPEFQSTDELAFMNVTQLARLVRAKKVSPVELTRLYLARLKRYGPKLNCVINLTEELALKQAGEAESEIVHGKYRGPLHGIPWGAKDLFATRGIPTTWGAEPYRGQIIDYDAAVVEKLRDAGAVLVAKLSMGALAQGGLWFGGMTKNPWKIEESSSGSSAGPASATAAGLVGFSVGTETLGSIISPSSRCGVVGLRPTYGRISRYGAMGLSWTMDKIGPLCRTVEDCALVLQALHGPDGRDITVVDVPFRWPHAVSVSQMRIGFLKGEFETGAEERKKLYSEALDALRSAGARLEPIELPQFPTGSLRIILSAEAAAAFDDLTRNGGVNQLSGQSSGDWPNAFRTARFIPAVEYLRAQRARSILMRQMQMLMAKWDAFVSPAPGSASLLLTNLTGHPAVSLPCGFVNGSPQAIMFTGNLYEESAPLAVAHAFEQATKWHTMRPKMDWA